LNFKEQNLQGRSFKKHDLQGADFSGADLRGVDFTGAKLANAVFANARTGLRISSLIIIFIISLLISFLSGYIAMLSGTTAQEMLVSGNEDKKLGAYIIIILLVFFVLLALWKGNSFTLKIAFPVVLLLLITGTIFKLTGIGTGKGALHGAMALSLFVLMFYVGTVARAIAGSLSSNSLFVIVAMGGAMFGRSLGGGIGTIVMAIACAVISKLALKGVKGFELLDSVALRAGSLFGTSFRSADLTKADFSNSTIKNTDFTAAKVEGAKWENVKKMYNLNEPK
jgi:hypothetical protein